ncbi:hypothetical protein AOLI_G00192600 [Acnodon oligacanthus]
MGRTCFSQTSFIAMATSGLRSHPVAAGFDNTCQSQDHRHGNAQCQAQLKVLFRAFPIQISTAVTAASKSFAKQKAGLCNGGRGPSRRALLSLIIWLGGLSTASALRIHGPGALAIGYCGAQWNGGQWRVLHSRRGLEQTKPRQHEMTQALGGTDSPAEEPASVTSVLVRAWRGAVMGRK